MNRPITFHCHNAYPFGAGMAATLPYIRSKESAT
jgi:hypothetical protein